ncbi:MAG TPA: hypothetical protein VMW17_17185 [Candidatus Binatia bacterium]|nr:hypothetical protein [Candidatus Binatia bacterium]
MAREDSNTLICLAPAWRSVWVWLVAGLVTAVMSVPWPLQHDDVSEDDPVDEILEFETTDAH